MMKPMHGNASDSNSKELPTQQTGDDAVEESSEESFPASDSPSWNAGHEAASVPSTHVETNESKEGCAVSFLMEERGEMDKLCERTPAERKESYTEPDNEKEAGGEG